MGDNGIKKVSRRLSYCKQAPGLLVLHRMKLHSRRIISLLLLLVTINGLLVTFGENVHCTGELPDAHQRAHLFLVNNMAQIYDNNRPSVPSPSNKANDHFCTGDCGCPCQAPLAPAPMAFNYSPTFTCLFNSEIIRYIPEVYLSLFVPPDSATV
jgi:hypothetical protein